MKDDDIKIGMKVLPYLKLGKNNLKDASVVYKTMLNRNLKYVYVSRIESHMSGYNKPIYVLSNSVNGSGDYFYSEDFELPVNLQRKQKLIKLYSKNER